jgi:cytochrome c5
MMVQKIIKSGMFVLVLTGFTGCYYDNKTELYPDQCDTAKVSFTTFIKPIIDKDCKVCHSGATPIGIIPLNNYSEIKASVQSGKLSGSVNGLNGYKPMPQGGTKWGECELSKLKSWIDAGAPNN